MVLTNSVNQDLWINRLLQMNWWWIRNRSSSQPNYTSLHLSRLLCRIFHSLTIATHSYPASAISCTRCTNAATDNVLVLASSSYVEYFKSFTSSVCSYRNADQQWRRSDAWAFEEVEREWNMLHANYKVEWTECDELMTDPRDHDIWDLASTIRRVALTQ